MDSPSGPSDTTRNSVPAADTPPIRVFFEEHPYENGPGGAKGIGELPMDGPAPAILNAVEMAIGRPVDAIPLLPEDLMRVMDESGGGVA